MIKKIQGKWVAVVGTATVLASQAHAAMPATTDIDTGIAAAAVTAGLAAALGLSIFLYRKAKAKAGQAIG